MAATKGPDKQPPARRRQARSLLGRLINWGGAALVWGAVAALGVVLYYAYDLPDVSQIREIERAPSVSLADREGVVFASFGDLYGETVQLADISPYLVQAVLATEDRRFYDHFGLDVLGLARAMWANWRAGAVVQGGSTISQQLAKNLFLTPERTLKRKVQELVLALYLEQTFTKDQILTLYLNRVYLGAGTYGVQAAARRYFATSAAGLTLAQSAMIAGLLKAPTRYAPTTDLKRAQARADQVIRNMVQAGYLDAGAAAGARARPATLKARRATRRAARYFAQWLLGEVAAYVGHVRRDITVVTTLDRKTQAAAETAIAKALAGEGRARAAGQAALVALSPDGAVRALVGGRDFGQSQFNRATQARRQPSSAFKPFVYLAALESGLRPDSRFDDRPITIDGWRPRNYSGKYLGSVTMAEALARSINSVAVQVSERVGRTKVIATARRLGITSPLAARPSIALGASEVTLMELTGAYATFANGGLGVVPYGVQEIRDRAGRVLYRRAGSGLGRVAPPLAIADMNKMLARVLTEGTGRAARPDRPAAGKTGTSQDFRDAWFVGYTAELVAGIWFGNDDEKPMKRVTGGGLPARTWRAFITAALAGRPPRALPAPSRRRPDDRVAGTIWDRLKARFEAVLEEVDPGSAARRDEPEDINRR